MIGTNADEKFDSNGSSATINAQGGDDEIIFHLGDSIDGVKGVDSLRILDRVTLEGGANNWKSGGQITDSDGNIFNVYEGTTKWNIKY